MICEHSGKRYTPSGFQNKDRMSAPASLVQWLNLWTLKPEVADSNPNKSVDFNVPLKIGLLNT